MSLDEKKNYELNHIQSQISNDSGQINSIENLQQNSYKENTDVPENN